MMKLEAAIREQHAFDDRLKNFLDIASQMTERELEIALARLLDMLKAEPDEEPHIRVKGEFLKLYYDLRKLGAKRQKTFARSLGRRPPGVARWRPQDNESEQYVKALASFKLLSQKQIALSTFKADRNVSDMVKLLSP